MSQGTPLDRALANHRVDPETGCWLWLGRVNDRGRGELTLDGRRRSAAAVYYEHHVGEIPDGFVVVNDVCNDRRCVNPSHMTAIHRTVASARGGRSAARLHSDDVRRIRDELIGAKGMSDRAIALEYGVPSRTIANIRAGRTWGDSASEERAHEEGWS